MLHALKQLDDRGDALEHPQRQPLQCLRIGDGIGVLHDEAGHKHLRLGGRHAARSPAA
jgi:hypothetical protein